MLSSPDFIEWQDTAPFSLGEDRVIEVGNVGSNIFHIQSNNFSFITFGVISQLASEIKIQGDFSPDFSNVVTCFVHAIPAATYQSPYDMAAPFNATGWLVINRPFTRVRVRDAVGAAHTYTRIYLRAWA